MKVLITGASGLLGKFVSSYLAEQGYEVLASDIKQDFGLDIAYRRCDIMDMAALLTHMDGCEAVVHLAAFPSPAQTTGSETFQVNVSGSFNVFEAAAKLGIKRIVQASSINALGCFWGKQEHEPHYLPVDEAHPRLTTDPYSLSKQLAEDIASYYWHREAISSCSLRFPGVFQTEHFESAAYRDRTHTTRAHLDTLARQDSQTRAQRFAALRQQAATFRGQYGMEYPKFGAEAGEGFSDDPLWLSYLFDRLVYWTFVTLDDVAQSVDKGLRADYSGSHPLFIHNHRNSLGYNSQTLAELFFPEVQAFKKSLVADEALISLDRARALIGFEPSEVLPAR